MGMENTWGDDFPVDKLNWDLMLASDILLCNLYDLGFFRFGKLYSTWEEYDLWQCVKMELKFLSLVYF